MAKNQEAFFTHRAERDEAVYAMLASREPVGVFRDAVTELATISHERAVFWAQKSGHILTPYVLLPLSGMWYRALRRVLGIVHMTNYLTLRTTAHVARYKEYCATCVVTKEAQTIDTFAKRMHEVVVRIQEKRTVFFSNVVLGFNDALIELTGALVGFSFALHTPRLIAIAGLVTGLSASMSMAASAFQQARYEVGRSPVKAAAFTGISYLVIALLLVLPFLVAGSVSVALSLMAGVIVILVVCLAFYSALLLERPYLTQLGEMFFFSLGIALVSFIIGRALGGAIGVSP